MSKAKLALVLLPLPLAASVLLLPPSAPPLPDIRKAAPPPASPATALRDIGPLLIIGGAEDHDGKAEILRRFIRVCGGKAARLVVVPAASGEPRQTGEKYCKILGRLGAGDVRALGTASRAEVDSPHNLEAVGRATGVYFTGGDQGRLVRLMRNTRVDKLLHKRRLEGLVIAGSSAGASMMTEFMAAGGEAKKAPAAGQVTLMRGMAFLPNLLIDPHFAQRGRMNRLLSALATRPQCIGLGIDTNTAVLVTGDEKAEVLGEGAVTVVDAGTMSHNNRPGREKGQPIALFGVTIHVLPRGCTYDFRLRRPVDPGDARQAGREAY